MKRMLLAAGLVLAVAGCGERTQSGPSHRKTDTVAWDAAQNPFVAPGWTAGDETSWQSQIRDRTASQNEYSRVSPRQ
jgi:hypothetical protein